MKLGILTALVGIALIGCGDKAATPASSSTVAPAKTASAGGLPAECEAYFKTVTTCVEKVGGSNPGVAMFKDQMEKSRAEWAKVPDKSTLGPTCKQMDDMFKQNSAPAMKC